MSIIKAIILGLIQGLTEFLPISSSGHLMLTEQLMELSNDLIFSLVLHLATLLAVILFYWKDIIYIIKNPMCKLSKCLIVAFIPTIILAIIIRKFLSDYIIINYIGYLFLLTAFILLIPLIVKKKLNYGLSYKSGLIIGFVQGIACLPGISRSGSTIIAGQMSGLTKEESVKFSFLLSIPIIIGGIIFETVFNTKVVISTIIGLPMIVGFVVAFITGLLSIKIVQRLALQNKFYWFSIYLGLLGLFCVVNSIFGII